MQRSAARAPAAALPPGCAGPELSSATRRRRAARMARFESQAGPGPEPGPAGCRPGLPASVATVTGTDSAAQAGERLTGTVRRLQSLGRPSLAVPEGQTVTVAVTVGVRHSRHDSQPRGRFSDSREPNRRRLMPPPPTTTPSSPPCN